MGSAAAKSTATAAGMPWMSPLFLELLLELYDEEKQRLWWHGLVPEIDVYDILWPRPNRPVACIVYVRPIKSITMIDRVAANELFLILLAFDAGLIDHLNCP
jgi:hypothetical protein